MFFNKTSVIKSCDVPLVFRKGGRGVLLTAKSCSKKEKNIYSILNEEQKMTETNQEINDYRGESAIPCSAKSVMEWREKYKKTLKLDIIEFFGKALGYGRELTDYWLRSEKKTYEADAFFAGCKEAYAAELYGAIWLSILEDWFKEDWRGQKAQKPTPSQLFEHGLKWRYAELEKTKNLSMRKPQFIRREAAAFSQQVYLNGKWQDEH